jgi:hypothetical protein
MDSSRSAMTLCVYLDLLPASNVRPDQSRRTVASRSRRLELRAKTARLVVVLSLFLMLIAAAVFIGGQSVIGPMLQEAMAQTRDRHRTGAIVFTMPDGTFCRHLAFDNKTGAEGKYRSAMSRGASARRGAHPKRLCLGGALNLTLNRRSVLATKQRQRRAF